MLATRTAPAAQLALPFLLPEGPSTVDGIPGQLDLVAAVMAHDPDAPASARRLAAELSAGSGVPMRALANGAITNAPACLTVVVDAAYDAAADRQCHGRTKARRRCSDWVVPEWKGSLVLSDGSHWCRQHAHQGHALTR